MEVGVGLVGEIQPTHGHNTDEIYETTAAI